VHLRPDDLSVGLDVEPNRRLGVPAIGIAAHHPRTNTPSRRPRDSGAAHAGTLGDLSTSPPAASDYDFDAAADPRRFGAALVVIVSVLIPVLDNTVLNVAIPTILHDFHTELPSLQWVVTGYSLTFATLLIIGGRLGDMFGHRRMFIVGVAIFGAGSLLAALSTSVPTLFLGEALIEGIGASLMIPATLSILSTTFRKPSERAIAFAAWGTTAGVAVAFGPLLGGFLTTNYSWRWAFGINVILAPLIVIGALVFTRPDERSGRQQRLDWPGAFLIAAGSFSLIFGLSEGATYGWWRPLQSSSSASCATSGSATAC
jgi:MFS family permease